MQNIIVSKASECCIVPLVMAHRWAVENLSEHWVSLSRNYGRAILPVALILAAGFVGTFSKYPEDLRRNISFLDGLVERGLKAETTASLPPTLQDKRVVDFKRHATHAYQILMLDGGSRPLIAAVFDNGYTLVCHYEDETALPVCQSFIPASR